MSSMSVLYISFFTVNGEGVSSLFTHSMFLGVMTKHQRVQIKPVHIREKFWAKDSFSAGRAKSETPARTRAHC